MSSIASSNVVNVPDNMSYVNVLRALWEESKPAANFKEYPEQLKIQEEEVSTPEKVAQLVKDGTFIDYAGGRLIKTDFAQFPKLKIFSYDRVYGTGAAQKALEKYNKIPSSDRFDKNDQYRFPAVAIQISLNKATKEKA